MSMEESGELMFQDVEPVVVLDKKAQAKRDKETAKNFVLKARIDKKTLFIAKCKNKKAAQLNIPSTFKGKRIVEVGYKAFEGMHCLENVTLEEGLQYIDRDAFRGCENLKSVTLPDSLETIRWDAFRDCKKLSNVAFGLGLKAMYDGAFYHCESLERIVVPRAVKELSNYVFHGCTALKEIVLGDGLTEIRCGVFRGCTALESIVIPDTVTIISNGAFEKCSSLKNVTIGQGVVEICNNAFGRCTSLTSIVIPNNVQKLGEALTNCEKLERVAIGRGVETLTWSLNFEGCTSLREIAVDPANPILKSVDGNLYSRDGKVMYKYAGGKTDECFVVPRGVEEIDVGAFGYSMHLRKVEIGGDVQLLAYHAFEECPVLTDVVMSEGLLELRDFVFSNCESLQSIVLPDSVTEIGECTFYLCKNLTNVVLGAGMKHVGVGAFVRTDRLTKVMYRGKMEQVVSIFEEGDDANGKEIVCEDGIVSLKRM